MRKWLVAMALAPAAIGPASAQAFIQNCPTGFICGYVSSITGDKPAAPNCVEFLINGDASPFYGFSVNSPGYASDLATIENSRRSNGVQTIFFLNDPTTQSTTDCAINVTPVGRIGY